MSDLAILRGFKDVILADAEKFSAIVAAASQLAKNYNFSKAYFPILEQSSTYKRVLGESSDIVNKEMYSFIDKGENQVTLRPEFTAGIARSVITNGLYDKLPLKFFSYGPLFRYERPQKGRQRQFYQLNFEIFGNESYLAELEMLLLLNELIEHLGLKQKVTLELNSLGSPEARQNYRAALKTYLQDYRSQLSEDSQKRLEVNPLRILDSKSADDQQILEDAPAIDEFYSAEDQEFFAKLQEKLSAFNISFKLNPKLVRGLDYYTQTVFEYTTELLGAQNAVFAGGRYDNLIAQMGGKATPAVGFAGGLERLVELAELDLQQKQKIIVVAFSEQQQDYVLKLVQLLRQQNLTVEQILGGGNLGKKLKKAAKHAPQYVVICGEDEIKNDQLQLKNFVTGNEQFLSQAELVEYLVKL